MSDSKDLLSAKSNSPPSSGTVPGGVSDTLTRLETFLGTPLPDHLKNDLKDKKIVVEVDEPQLPSVIDLAPPFLKIKKLVVTGQDGHKLTQTKSVGTGLVTQADTEGHYNELISLALCGQLMASTAAIHLAALFPKSAPQAIEVNGIKPLGSKGGELWMPSKHGTRFLTEVTIVKKKMQLVCVTSKISFGRIPYGVIDELKFVIIPATVLTSAGELPVA